MAQNTTDTSSQNQNTFNPANYQAIQLATYQRDDNPDKIPFQVIRSSSFAATLARAGIRDDFKKLQILLIQIDDTKPDIHSYASGLLFNGIMDELYEKRRTIFDNEVLFGKTEPNMSSGAIATTKAALRRVTTAFSLIKEALDLVESMGGRVSGLVKNMNSNFVSYTERTESLISWALRKGAQINIDAVGVKNLGINTKATRETTDLSGLLVLLDNLTLELETLLNLPAYYRTATNSDTSKVEVPVKIVYVRVNDTIETIAQRVLGDADKASMIMEFNDLTPADIMGEGWSGSVLKIPYVEAIHTQRMEQNFVLDAQTGIQALGKDLANDVTSENGDLKVLNYTDTFMQGMENIIMTAEGAIPEEPDYGNRLLKLESATIPQIQGSMLAPEIRRCLMADPRVARVENIIVGKEGDTIRLSCQVIAINHILEAELNKNLDG